MKEAKFWTPLSQNKALCFLCNHNCTINKGQIGLCRARKNVNGVLQSLVYGYPLQANVDPIEKKPLFHYYPGSQTYSIGTLGCNFACANCQNWDISQAEKIEGTISKLDEISPEKIVEEAVGNECVSISYTYNEPTVFTEYALDIMKLAHQNGVKNVWVSNGYMSEECLDAILPYLDAINIDLKAHDKDFYKSNCSAQLEPVLNNLRRLANAQKHLEITTLLIPGLSDNFEMLDKLANFIVTELSEETPWHVTKFSPGISWKLKEVDSTGDDLIYGAYEIGKAAGLKYVYTGNIPGDSKENTYCPRCGDIAIRRMGYHIERLDVDGSCKNCDKNLDITE